MRTFTRWVSFTAAALMVACGGGGGGSAGGGGTGGGGGGGGGIAAYDVLFTNGEDLCGMRLDGSGKAVLKAARAADDYDTFEHMAVSPDGTKIVYAAACGGVHFLRVMGSDLGRPTDLTERCGPAADRPAFSPDGTKIAFIATNREAAERGSYLYVMNADGSDQRRVTALEPIYDPVDDRPAFSADGTRILFTTNRNANVELWSIGVDGAGPQILVANDGFVNDPVPHWVAVDHGSGATYVVESYVAVLGNTANVYRLSSGARLTNEADHDIQRPAVSPDGTKLVFGRVMGFSTQDLQVLDIASGQATTISAPAFAGWNADPVFVP